MTGQCCDPAPAATGSWRGRGSHWLWSVNIPQGVGQVRKLVVVPECPGPGWQDLLTGGDHPRDFTEHELKDEVGRTDGHKEPPGRIGFSQHARHASWRTRHCEPGPEPCR